MIFHFPARVKRRYYTIMDNTLFFSNLERLETSDDAPALIRTFDRIIAEHGGKGFVATAYSASEPSRILLYASQKEPFSFLDAESPWWADDPIVPRLAAGELRPFSYEESWTNPLPTAAPRWSELAAAGLDRGIVFPTSRPPYVGAVLIFAAGEPAALAAMQAQQPMLHLLSTYFHAAIVDLAPGENDDGIIRNTLFNETIKGRKYKLSSREIECLRWLALGKSAQDIACIEDLSVFTVRSHLRAGQRKLNASTQAQAVAQAIKHGLVKV